MAGILKGGKSAREAVEMLGKFVRPYYKKIGKTLLPLVKDYAKDLIQTGGKILTAQDLEQAKDIKGGNDGQSMDQEPPEKKVKSYDVASPLLAVGKNLRNYTKKNNKKLGDKIRNKEKKKKKIQVVHLKGGKKKHKKKRAVKKKKKTGKSKKGASKKGASKKGASKKGASKTKKNVKKGTIFD